MSSSKSCVSIDVHLILVQVFACRMSKTCNSFVKNTLFGIDYDCSLISVNPKYGQFRTCSWAASLHSILGCNIIYTASICIDALEVPLERICCPQNTLPSLDSMIQPQTLPRKCVIWGQREICACGKFLTPQICFGLLLYINKILTEIMVMVITGNYGFISILFRAIILRNCIA